ncbi:hypothetical protein BHE74_00033511 [Ensete ventricosum]|nr:hypothetical protein BHE74_00033511 [Ensete ventricosum]
MCGCSGCDFDVGLSNLAGLFLQDKTSRVVGSRDGPSDDQVRVDLKGEVRCPLLGRQSFFSFFIEVERERESASLRLLGGPLGCHFYTYISSTGQVSVSSSFWRFLPTCLMSPVAPTAIRAAGCVLLLLCCRMVPSGCRALREEISGCRPSRVLLQSVANHPKKPPESRGVSAPTEPCATPARSNRAATPPQGGNSLRLYLAQAGGGHGVEMHPRPRQSKISR